MIPPPPSSTLFPYTTLFRSLLGGVLGEVAHVGVRERVPQPVEDHAVHELAVARLDAAAHPVDVVRRVGHRFQDRKSTRLNSSHTVISYAVFCLKKKKKLQ